MRLWRPVQGLASRRARYLCGDIHLGIHCAKRTEVSQRELEVMHAGHMHEVGH